MRSILERRALPAVAVTLLAASAAVGASAARPEQQLIAFERQAGTAAAADLYVVRPDGTGLRRLTSDQSSADPAWSPDRRRIAFVSGRGKAFWAPDLYVMDARGRNVRRLTRGPTASDVFYAASDPTWTPDGKTIVFVRTAVRAQRARSDLWAIGADGRNLRRLTATRGQEAGPAYSEDGLLAFVRDGQLYVKLRRQRAAKRVTRGESPAWAQGGYFIAFARDGVVYRVGADGKGLRRVTDGGSPSWSSDGGRIVVATQEGLVSVLRNGTDAREVTRHDGTVTDYDASWSTAQARRG